MTSLYSKIILTFSLLFTLNHSSIAQTTMSGGIGLALLNIASEDSFEKANRFTNNIYLKESENFSYPSLTAGISIDRQIAERFFASYHFMLFIKTIEADFKYDIDYTPACDFEGTSQIMSTTHAGSMNFQPTENIAFGIGAFYQMIRPSYFTLLSRENGFLHYPSHQAGSLITGGYHWNKWNIQVSYFKSIGNMFLANLADSIDVVKLSVVYEFYQFKTKKERKMRKLQN